MKTLACLENCPQTLHVHLETDTKPEESPICTKTNEAKSSLNYQRMRADTIQVYKITTGADRIDSQHQPRLEEPQLQPQNCGKPSMNPLSLPKARAVRNPD